VGLLKNMYNEFDKINNFIKNYFGNNLVSLATFGAFSSQKKFRITSDIDYIIILNNLKTRQDKISRNLKKKLKNSFPLVAFNIYSKKDFTNILKHNPWFILSIKLGYKVYIDKDNFFKNIIENNFKNIKQRKIGHLAWYIKKQNFGISFQDHYLKLSKQYFDVARLLYKNQIFNIALESLLNSIHCYMIRKLLDKNIFITSGEISQLFFNIYPNDKIFKLRDSFLILEQKINQKHSFDFDKNGKMLFLSNKSSENKLIFNKAVKNFGTLQIFFNNRI